MGLAFLVLLAGCGDLPHPFKGYPGATAMRLAQPPPARMAIPLPTDSLLTDDAARAWSTSMADTLLAQELPVVAGEPMGGDWRLVLSAKTQGATVIPTYTVINPTGASEGSVDGPPVPAADWAAGAPVTVKAAADAEAPKVVALMSSIEAHRQQSDPNSLLNRPPRIYLAGVSGAPGDGNTSLAMQMNAHLPHLGDVMEDSASQADFTVRGEIKTAPGAGKSVRVEIQWIVVDSHGRESGRVVQINEVPPGTLDRYWGEVAEVVATEAAGGVHEVIVQATGRGKDADDKKGAGDKQDPGGEGKKDAGPKSDKSAG
jgi:hypothetical protein